MPRRPFAYVSEDEHQRLADRVRQLEAALVPFTLLTDEGSDRVHDVYTLAGGQVCAKGSLLESIERARRLLASGKAEPTNGS